MDTNTIVHFCFLEVNDKKKKLDCFSLKQLKWVKLRVPISPDIYKFTVVLVDDTFSWKKKKTEKTEVCSDFILIFFFLNHNKILFVKDCWNVDLFFAFVCFDVCVLVIFAVTLCTQISFSAFCFQGRRSSLG